MRLSLLSVLPLCAAVLIGATAPAGAQQVEPSVVLAPSESPFDLVGSGYSLDERISRGEALPEGASVPQVIVTVAASQPAPTRVDVTLSCPRGARLVDGPYANGVSREIITAGSPFGRDRSHSTRITVTAIAGLPSERRVRVGVLCLELGRLKRLRAQQERTVVARTARTRPEVRRAPRRRICSATLLQRRPGAVFIGNVSFGDRVRVLRRSRSGAFAEVLALSGSQRLGWIRAGAICGS